MRKIFVFLFLIITLNGCRNPPRAVDASFYYWRSGFQLSRQEADILDSLGCSRLFVKFFDVDRNKATGRVIPVAPIRFSDSSYSRFAIVPVIYITNAALTATKGLAAEALADSIMLMLSSICHNNMIKYKEVQIDCDWTASTQNQYFQMLRHIKQQMPDSSVLSCTIRLHQVKYKNRTGVPPVDRGMLMYYNMGQAQDINERNSIYDHSNAGKYVGYVRDYPLALDVALPIFSWGVLFREHKAKELLNGFSKMDFEGDRHFHAKGGQWYEVDSSFFIHGYYLKEHDLIRLEEISPYLCREAAGQLAPALKTQKLTLIFFDLQTQNTERYGTRDFKEVLDILR